MRKNRFFMLAVGLSFFLLFFTACSQQVSQDTSSVSINFSDKTFRSLFSELDSLITDDTVMVNCEVTLIIDGKASEPQSHEFELNLTDEDDSLDSLTDSEKPTTFTFPNIPLGSKIQASAKLLIGDLKFAGVSEEKPLQDEVLHLPIKVSLVEDTEEEQNPDDNKSDSRFGYKIKFKVLKDGLNESTNKEDYVLDESLTISGSFLPGWQGAGNSDAAEDYLNDTLYEKLMDIYAQGYQILDDDKMEPDYSYNPYSFSTTITYYCVKKEIVIFATGGLGDDNFEFIGYADDDEDDFCDYLIRSEIYGKYAIGKFDISNNKIHCYELYTFNHKNNKLTPVAGGKPYEIDSTLGETFEYTSNNAKTITFTVRE